MPSAIVISGNDGSRLRRVGRRGERRVCAGGSELAVAELGIGSWSYNRFVSFGIPRVPPPVNEPNLTYLPGSPERATLKARLAAMASEKIDIPLIVGGCEIRTGRM